MPWKFLEILRNTIEIVEMLRIPRNTVEIVEMHWKFLEIL
jgi:hypothetical protein